jgi:hypothetical protein
MSVNVLIRPRRTPAAPPPEFPTVTWTQQSITSGPSFVGFTSLLDDPVSGRVLVYAQRSGGSGIYSTDMFSYTVGPNLWTRLGGTGSLSNLCGDSSASDVLPWPVNRHPYQQMAIDTTRNVLWLANGVCAGAEPDDLWKYALNSNPTLNTWTDVSPVAAPTMQKAGALVYCANADVLLMLGPNDGTFWELWVYGPTAGALSANQLAAGCVTPNVWRELTPAGMPSSAFSQGPQAYYDAALGEVLIFAGLHGSGTYGGIRAIHRYAPLTQTWTVVSPTGLPTETESNSAEMPVAQITSGSWAGKYLYHQTSHSTATSGTPADFLFDPATDVMTALSSSGSGPARNCYLTWNATAGKVVAWAYASGSVLNIWQGALS